jgi:hypothetical protein
MAKTAGLRVLFSAELFIKHGDSEISSRLQQNVFCVYDCNLLNLYVLKIHEAAVCLSVKRNSFCNVMATMAVSLRPLHIKNTDCVLA